MDDSRHFTYSWRDRVRRSSLGLRSGSRVHCRWECVDLVEAEGREGEALNRHCSPVGRRLKHCPPVGRGWFNGRTGALATKRRSKCRWGTWKSYSSRRCTSTSKSTLRVQRAFAAWDELTFASLIIWLSNPVAKKITWQGIFTMSYRIFFTSVSRGSLTVAGREFWLSLAGNFDWVVHEFFWLSHRRQYTLFLTDVVHVLFDSWAKYT